MAYECIVLADSRAPCGSRLTTLQVTFPRPVLAEMNTHRMLSRNSASSRAIPVEKMLERVLSDPFVPIHWGKNQKGMQAESELDADEVERARRGWLTARDYAVQSVRYLQRIGLHKQVTNRLLEPFMWHTAIISATDWRNFFALRCHPAAMPEIRRAAELMRDAIAASTPRELQAGQWHLPLVHDEDWELLVELEKSGEEIIQGASGLTMAQVSCARCARVSYLTHDGRRDLREDLALAVRLQQSGHMSPFEHAAQAEANRVVMGNFVGFTQYRKMLPNEDVFRGQS